mmetsp:Transcript_11572/g.20313  ORF Transcript_11572/g.20313 Transcript_11572/m.20313 type:complete len:229 (+) Transcript_11572:533-1219(+)
MFMAAKMEDFFICQVPGGIHQNNQVRIPLGNSIPADRVPCLLIIDTLIIEDVFRSRPLHDRLDRTAARSDKGGFGVPPIEPKNTNGRDIGISPNGHGSCFLEVSFDAIYEFSGIVIDAEDTGNVPNLIVESLDGGGFRWAVLNQFTSWLLEVSLNSLVVKFLTTMAAVFALSLNHKITFTIDKLRIVYVTSGKSTGVGRIHEIRIDRQKSVDVRIRIRQDRHLIIVVF